MVEAGHLPSAGSMSITLVTNCFTGQCAGHDSYI
jgi:hypothetical protein